MALPELDHKTDRFVLEGRAGGGGMGDVYRATDRDTGAIVAVKVLRTSASPIERMRFQREIAVIADLRHPNIVGYLAHGSLPDGRPFYAMEWLDGEDLVQRQRHAPLGMRDAVEVIRRSAQAMAAVHARGIVHRDLKLGNIFVIRGTSVKLIDFGVVRMPGEDLAEDRGAILGTPHFMAPEQARGEGVDARADVYSLGAALFKLLTGRNVFETEHIVALLGRLVLEDPPNPASLRFDIPEALDRVVLQAIQRRPEDRFDNAGELARALARVGELGNEPPARDGSASAVRRAPPPSRMTIEPPPPETERPRKEAAERRVVAAAVFDLGTAKLDAAMHKALWEILGQDARVETLLGGRVVTMLGLTRSVGDEPIRAARAALLVTRGIPEAKAVVAAGHAIATPNSSRAKPSSLAAQALERAAEQLQTTQAGTARVDPGVLATLAGRFVVQEDGYGAVLVREDPSGFGSRVLLGRPTPTVGRDKELALLVSVYQELLDEGTPRAALVTGSPGIGKSRVRQELLSRLETSGLPPEVLVVRGDPMSQGSSLSCLGRALRAGMGVHDGESLDDQIRKVRQHLAFRLPKALRFLTGFLSELLGVPFPDERDEPLRAARRSPQLMQSRTRMALEALVRSQADLMPQLVFIDDAHWADETTIDLLDWLLGCPDLKFAVFAFGRPEIEARFPQLWANKNTTRLSLAPLSPSAADKLVRVAIPSADPRTRTTIIERSGGNALFLEELVRAAAAGQDELPLTVQAMMQMRLDRMPKALKESVRAASVLGPIFWTGALSGLLERDAASELAELEHIEIITKQDRSRISGETEWTFRHPLLREAAYASILDEDRTEMHRFVAKWLESKGDADVGLIAQHADAGEDFESAAKLYAKATRQALSAGAHLETALELAERGLDCGPPDGVRAELLLAAAKARIPLGRLQDGVRAAEQAAELSTVDSDTWAEAQCLAATALIESGRAEEGDLRAERALSAEGAGKITVATRVKLIAARVRGWVDLGRARDALRLADEALVLARDTSSTEALIRVLDARLFALMQLADPSEVVAAGPSVVDIADAAGDVVLATRARINTASSMNLLGLFEESRWLLDRALGDARDRRMRILEAFALHNLGMTEARLGLVDRGIEMQREAGKIADETGAARLRIHARVYEALLLLWRVAQARAEGSDIQDASDLAAAQFLAAFVEAEVRGVPVLLPTSKFVSAAVAYSRGAMDEALELAREAVKLMQERPVEEWEELTYLTLIETLFVFDRDADADRVIETAFSAICDRARKISRAEHRNAYLERIPEVARIAELARERLAKTLPFFAALPLKRPPAPSTSPPTLKPQAPSTSPPPPTLKPPKA
ncbi:MAG: protein kinase [Polyangiaceae bacterium]|nr:protein kinase [Polyangiaceae bacterium]